MKTVDFTVEWYNRVASTNNICAQRSEEGAAEGLVIAAMFQEMGRGQRGNMWESDAGKNLTFSILLRPSHLRVEEQFYLSKAAAVSVCDWVSAYVQGGYVTIKWPNDVYINDSKVAGILIENSFSSPWLGTSVVGIGINLNQQTFSDDIPNPTSMGLVTGNEFDIKKSLDEFLGCFAQRYEMLFDERSRYLLDDYYLSKLYRRDSYHEYCDRNGKFTAKIAGVKPTGELVLQFHSGEQRAYAFKEVMFVV
mgnify:CR=1 FL=1